jgi:hypothetical protein
MDSETGRTSNYERSVRVIPQNARIGLHERQDALFGIETSDKKDGLALPNFLLAKKQFTVDSIEYNSGLNGQRWRSRRKTITKKATAHHYSIDAQCQVIQHLRAPVAEVIVLQMKHERAPVAHIAQNGDPLRPIVNVKEIEFSKPRQQRPQPQLIFVTPRDRDSTHKVASAP